MPYAPQFGGMSHQLIDRAIAQDPYHLQADFPPRIGFMFFSIVSGVTADQIPETREKIKSSIELILSLDSEIQGLFFQSPVTTIVVSDIKEGLAVLGISPEGASIRPAVYELRRNDYIGPEHFILVEGALLTDNRFEELLANLAHCVAHVALTQQQIDLPEQGRTPFEAQILAVSVKLLERLRDNLPGLNHPVVIDPNDLKFELFLERNRLNGALDPLRGPSPEFEI